MAYKKITKNATDNEVYVIDLTDVLETDETVSSIVSLTSTPAGLTISEEDVNASEVTVDDLTIESYHSIQARIAGGEEGTEYKLTLVFSTSESDEETINVLLIVADTSSTEFQNYYGSVTEGGDYFNTKLNVPIWTNATNINKRKGLIQATRIIDRLNFVGEKSEETQVLEFPRYPDEIVPLDIEKATYEIAYRLLAGFDEEHSESNVGVLSRQWGPVSTSYSEKFRAEHIAAGVPSVEAWRLLKPYLRNPRRIQLNRVN